MPQLEMAGTPVDSCNPSNPENVPAGTVIDVSPLLSVLETRMRPNVAQAANVPKKNAKFGSSGWPTYMSESQWINSVFNGPPPNPTPSVNCNVMATLIMAEDVMTALKPGKSPEMGLVVAKFGMMILWARRRLFHGVFPASGGLPP